MEGKRILRSGRWTVTMGVTLIAVGVLSFNAWASFTGSVSTSHEVGSGTLALSLSADDMTNKLTTSYDGVDIAPGDTMQRALDLTVSESVSATAVTLTTNATVTSDLDADATDGLQILIQKCSGSSESDGGWLEAGSDPAFTYTCPGGGSIQTVLASRAVIGSSLALSNLNLAGTVNHLKVTLTLPGTADDSFQDLDSTIQYTFNATQRAGTDK